MNIKECFKKGYVLEYECLNLWFHHYKFYEKEETIEFFNSKNEFIGTLEGEMSHEFIKKIDEIGLVSYTPSNKKVLAAKKATATRVTKTKKKIESAINMLRLENRKITPYSIASYSGVSFNTVKKYVDY